MNISFSNNIKAEIIEKIDKKRVFENRNAEAVLYGTLLTKNVYRNKNKIEIRINNEQVIMFYSKIFHVLNIENIFTDEKKTSIIVEISNLQNIIDRNILNENNEYILLGMFLAGGYISNPNKEYHFEIKFNKESNLEDINKYFLNLDIESKIYKDSKIKKIYIKKSENISDLLVMLNATKGALAIQNVKIEKETKKDITRKVNSEIANMNKTIETSVKQLNAIEYIEQNNIEVDIELKKIIEVRKKYPNDSLSRLAEILKMSKSTLNLRLQKILKLGRIYNK